MLAREIWEYDKDKRVNVINNGYNLITIWENETKDFDDQQLKEYINGIIKDQKY